MTWWGVAVAWSGWAVAVAAALALRRRLAVVADAEHELRGAATAIGLAAERELNPLLQLELDRIGAALADLAAARGARPPVPGDLDAGRLAQVLGNVVANAAEHGLGPVEVHARREGDVVRLELGNRDRAGRSGNGPGRGRGILIAKRAARELGGRVSVESHGGVTRTIVELPVEGGGGAHAGGAAAGIESGSRGQAGDAAAGSEAGAPASPAEDASRHGRRRAA